MRTNKLRADMGGGEGPTPYENGSTITIESAPDPSLVGQTGTVKSSAHGLYYLVDVGGTSSYHPDSALSGERPGSTEPAPPPPPVVDPVAPPPAGARFAGGASVAGQIEAAKNAARWSRLRALVTSATTDDEAEGFLRAAALELPAFRAAEEKRKAAEVKAKAETEDAERRELLVQAIAKSGLPRTSFLAVDKEGNVTGPAPGYTRDELALATLRAQVAGMGAASVAANVKGPVTPANSDEAGLAERARRSGMTIDERREAEARVNANTKES